MTVKTRLVPPLVVRRRSEDINTPPSTADAKLFANQRSCHCKENLQPPPHHTIKNLDHVKLILKSLHWLPVRARIKYTIWTLCFNVIKSTGPQYLSEFLHLYTPSRDLRSSVDTRILKIPRSDSKAFGQKLFSQVGPSTWNGLRHHLDRL